MRNFSHVHIKKAVLYNIRWHILTSGISIFLTSATPAASLELEKGGSACTRTWRSSFKCWWVGSSEFLSSSSFFLSLMLVRPKMLILVCVSACILFRVSPLGPSNRPTRLCCKYQTRITLRLLCITHCFVPFFGHHKVCRLSQSASHEG